LSMTLFLSEPDEYDGGELVIEDQFGAQQVKLPAGHMVLYPSTSLHQVTPVTRGCGCRPSSGCRAWFVRTSGARSCSISTSRSSHFPPGMAPIRPRRCA